MRRGREQEKVPAYVRAVDLLDNPGVNSDFDVIGPVLVEAREELEALTRRAVERAVDRKEPWTRIGPALGVTRQAAMKKYGRPPAP